MGTSDSMTSKQPTQEQCRAQQEAYPLGQERCGNSEESKQTHPLLGMMQANDTKGQLLTSFVIFSRQSNLRTKPRHMPLLAEWLTYVSRKPKKLCWKGVHLRENMWNCYQRPHPERRAETETASLLRSTLLCHHNAWHIIRPLPLRCIYCPNIQVKNKSTNIQSFK